MPTFSTRVPFDVLRSAVAAAVQAPSVDDLLRALAGQVVPRTDEPSWDSSATLFRRTPVLPEPDGPTLSGSEGTPPAGTAR